MFWMYDALYHQAKKLREAKYTRDIEDKDPQEHWRWKAWLFPEFAKIVCISLGLENKDGETIRLKSLVWKESEILAELMTILWKVKDPIFVGHNIINYDLPFITKRAMRQQVKVHPSLYPLGLKPREIKHIDTMNLYKFGGWSSTSLAVICDNIWVPTPKSEIDGSQVWHTFYETGNMELIQRYCEADVVATHAVHQKIINAVASNQEESLRIQEIVKSPN